MKEESSKVCVCMCVYVFALRACTRDPSYAPRHTYNTVGDRAHGTAASASQLFQPQLPYSSFYSIYLCAFFFSFFVFSFFF